MPFTKIGALWLKDGANGKYMAGEIERQCGEKIRVMVFKNTYKTEGDTKPDYTINMVLDDDPPTTAANPPLEKGGPGGISTPPDQPDPPPLTDDIPF